MNEVIEKEKTIITNNIKSLIYEVRGVQVILDSDLATLYECVNGTKDINKAVKRNMERFPEDFYFQLTKKEYQGLSGRSENKSLRFQFGTLEEDTMKGKHRKYLPYAFTEQGVAMLSSVLRTPKASEVSIGVMRTFVEMRRFINTNKNLFERIITIENKVDNRFLEYDDKFNIIFNELQKEENIKQKIFYEGQIYDAYSLVYDIIKNAKNNIIIIDNYVTKIVLDLLSNKNNNVNITIIGKNSLNLSQLDIAKFNEQYPNLTMKYSEKFHDRFIIIDNDIIYHLGASLKDLGKKCFAINRMEDKTLLDKLC